MLILLYEGVGVNLSVVPFTYKTNVSRLFEDFFEKEKCIVLLFIIFYRILL